MQLLGIQIFLFGQMTVLLSFWRKFETPDIDSKDIMYLYSVQSVQFWRMMLKADVSKNSSSKNSTYCFKNILWKNFAEMKCHSYETAAGINTSRDIFDLKSQLPLNCCHPNLLVYQSLKAQRWSNSKLNFGFGTLQLSAALYRFLWY